jgi:hypothetical protein
MRIKEIQMANRGRPRSKPSEGLGDTIEKITEATGIKAAVKWLAGDDCGCEARKEKLNKIFRYSKPKCLTEDEHTWLSTWFQRNPHSVKPDEQKQLITIYNRVFGLKKQMTGCNSCIADINNRLKKVFEAYEAD